MMHLPTLQELPQFRITALCDISQELLDKVGSLYGVESLYTDYNALLDNPDVEAILICNFDHGKVVEAALAADKHMMVEKPIAFTSSEAETLVARACESGKTALVGYMKFYDRGYIEGRAAILEMGRPKAVRVHDFAGLFDPYDGLYTLHRGTDIAPDVASEEPQEVAARIDAMLGASHAGYRDLYQLVLMLGSHDLAALRGLYGAPKAVLYAKAVTPSHIVSLLDYGEGVTATVEISFGADYAWFDEFIEVHGQKDEVRIDFSHPYVRNAPAKVRIRASKEDMTSETFLTPFPEDAFRKEWQHFAECIRGAAAPITPLAGGLEDLKLAEQIIKALPPLA